MEKKIDEILLFMVNNNLDYKNVELVSNIYIFTNGKYLSSSKLNRSINSFERRYYEKDSQFIQTSINLDLQRFLEEMNRELQERRREIEQNSISF